MGCVCNDPASHYIKRNITRPPAAAAKKKKKRARARAPSNKKRAQPSVIRNLSDYHRSIPFRIYSMEWKQLTTPACCVYNAQQQLPTPLIH